MKYGVTASNLAEKVALAMGVVPIPAVDSMLAAIRMRSISSAVRLGVFEALGNGGLDAAQIAERCAIGAQGAFFLLRTLVWAGYLECRGSQYMLSAMARNTMLKSAPRPLVGFVRWNATVWEMLSGFENYLRAGQGWNFHDCLTDPGHWADYQRAMLEGARFAARTLARSVPVKPGAQRLLDIAGSHGLLGASICRKHPPMTSCVLDLPNAVEHARALAREEKIDDIVEHRAGDLRVDSFDAGNDVVLLSNILHNLIPSAIPEILTRVVDSLTPQATVAIWDVETPSAASKPGAADAFAMFCWIVSTSGCFTGEDYAGWLRGAGLRDVKIKRPLANPGQALVTGRRL